MSSKEYLLGGRIARNESDEMNAAPVVPRADLRDYLAAERTFLAWIRTGLALMGFGFVVARFGLFLQQLWLVGHNTVAPPYGESLWFGTAFILAGVSINLATVFRFLRIRRQLDNGDSPAIHSFAQPIAAALFLALVGLGMAIYLISVRDSSRSKIIGSKVHDMSPTVQKGVIDKPSVVLLHEFWTQESASPF